MVLSIYGPFFFNAVMIKVSILTIKLILAVPYGVNHMAFKCIDIFSSLIKKMLVLCGFHVSNNLMVLKLSFGI